MLRYLAGAFLLFSSGQAFAQSSNSCTALLQHGITDISKKYSSNHAVVSNYQRHCGTIDDSTSDRTVLQAEGELLGFGGGSSDADITRARRRIENWCNINKNFAESNSALAEEVRSINTSALQAFNSCQKFQRRDIFLEVQRGDELARNVTITIDSRSNGDYRFTGMVIEGFSCKYFTDGIVDGGGRSEKATITSEDRLNIPIKNGNIHIDCSRQKPTKTEVQGVGEIAYAYGSIRILTNDQALLLTYPEVVETYYVTPPSSIVAIAGESCPAGWSVYEASVGRFLVGAGESNGRTFELTTLGGTVTHAHSGNTSHVGGVGKDDDGGDSHATGPHSHSFGTNSVENIPPYVAVTYCYRKP